MITSKDSSRRYNSFMISDILDCLEDNIVEKCSTVKSTFNTDHDDGSGDQLITRRGQSTDLIAYQSDKLFTNCTHGHQIALRHQLLTYDPSLTNGPLSNKYCPEFTIDSRHAHIFYEIQLRRKMMLQSKPRKGGQIRFTHKQTLCLEEKFNHYHYLNSTDRRLLAQELDLTERQVKTWFQNRRAKDRRLKGTDCGDNKTDGHSTSGHISYFHPWSDDESTMDKMESI